MREVMVEGVRLVGRGAELSELERRLARAAAGQAGCVLLVGDAGVGKTRLAREVIVRHRGSVAALTAAAHAMSQVDDFGIWAEALESGLHERAHPDVLRLCGGFARDVASLLHSVAAAQGATERARPPRPRLLQGIAALVANLAHEAPLAVFLDDVHLADTSSWQALNHLVRNLPRARWLLLLATRPGELAENELANEVALALEQAGLLYRLQLQPLNPEGVAELASAILRAADVPPALSAWLYERSQGYPLFVNGLMRALVERGGDLSNPALAGVPDSLSDRVKLRMQRLDRRAVACLEMLAVVAQPLAEGDLAALMGFSLDACDAYLEGLLRVRLVVATTTEGAGSYEVTHPLVRDAVYESIGASRRRALHLKAARHLYAAGALASAAAHFRLGAETGDEEAIEAVVTALADAESRDSHREALVLLKSLLALIPSGDPKWWKVFGAINWGAGWSVEHRADAEASIGVQALRELERLAEASGDSRQRGIVQLRLANFLGWAAADWPRAEAAARMAIELLDEAGARVEAAAARHELAWLLGLSGNLRGQLELEWEVQAAVQSEGDEVLLAEATCGLGAAQVVAGNLGAGERNLATSAEMAARQGRPYREAWAKAIQAWSLTWRGRIREAKHLLATDPALNAALADIPPVGAVVAWYEGDLSGCVESVADLDRTNPGGLGPRRAWVGAIAALALAEMGRQPDARRFLERVESVYQGRDWYTHTRRNRWARGAVALLGGNAAEGLRSMREAYAAYRLMGVGSEIDVLLEDIAESAALMSDSAVSRWAADEITTIPIAGESPFTRALIDLAEAWASHAEQRFTESAIAADAALDYLRDSPYRLFAARSLDVRGRSSLAHDRPVAITFLKEAAAGYARCTATLRRTRVLDLLREAGSTGRRAALTGLGVQALTTREREVAELVVEGLTSREIGDRLRIGKRTVDTHVDHVLAKTGLRSRLELARKGSSLGLVD